MPHDLRHSVHAIFALYVQAMRYKLQHIISYWISHGKVFLNVDKKISVNLLDLHDLRNKE